MSGTREDGESGIRSRHKRKGGVDSGTRTQAGEGQGASRPAVGEVLHAGRRGRKAGKRISWRVACGQEFQEDQERWRRKEEKWAGGGGGGAGRDAGKKRYRKHR